MCGICGIYQFDGKPADRIALRGMTRLIAHRGPDGEGHHAQGRVAIGHRSLAIIDPKNGAQPKTDSTGRYTIAFNGEIYNYRELQASLRKRGSAFKTNTDTEVILEGFARDGPAFFAKLNGMFTIAIVDSKTQSLTLARDRLGIKPLYLYEAPAENGTSNLLLFASEIKAFYAHSQFTAQANPDAIKEYLTFSNLHHNISFFQNVRQLPPGTWLRLEGTKREERAFWTSSYAEAKDSHEERIKEFRTLLDASVKRHMISDVPLGCYLSGGIDSSGVTVTAHRIRTAAAASSAVAQKKPSPLHVFTGTFPEGGKYSELSAARTTAQAIGATHHVVTVTPADFRESIEAVTYALDEPRAGMGAFPQYHVSKLVRKHATVVLTGHGGDELFAGYPLFKARMARSILRKPGAALRAFFSTKPSELPHMLYYLFYPIIQPEVGYGTFVLFSPKEQRALFTESFARATAQHDAYAYVRALAANKQLSPEARVQEIYLRTYLPSLFIVEDKVGMAHSIEARTPLCDNEMLAFSQSVALSDKLAGGQLKSIPRDALRDRLPAELYTRPKQGFPTPLSLWFRGPLHQYLIDILLSKRALARGIVRGETVEKLLRKHASRSSDGLRDYVEAARLWSLLQVELWHRIFIDDADGIRRKALRV